jgi:hypothetical protein
MATAPTGNGTIGLISEGQALDAYLSTMEDKHLAKSIVKFMRTFSRVARNVHNNIPVGKRDVILTALREYYQVEYKVEFGKKIEKKPFTLGMGYIKRLTSPKFAPTTKTQLSILRKKTTTS